jgi:FtsP/CotA-like multicopper oxidase with cupredoxin domain
MKHRPVLALALATVAFATVAAAALGGGNGRLYEFRGELLNASATSAQVQIDGGNQVALRALLGQSQNQTFALDSKTEFLVWSHGVPHVAAVTDLKQGDAVTVRIRAAAGATLPAIEGTPARVVADRGANTAIGGKPLWLYIGTVTGAQSGGHIALHVSSGNWRALRSMLGQSLDQTFSYDAHTIFVLWQGGVPTLISPSQLVVGDRISVRIRAPRSFSLAQVEAVPANHVGDHEPGSSSP